MLGPRFLTKLYLMGHMKPIIDIKYKVGPHEAHKKPEPKAERRRRVELEGAAMGEEVEEPIQAPPFRGRHIRKRALRNKALSISFDEKDLRDYVTGFHKRKKKRRKEALKQQGEAERRKRIDLRKKRKQERDYVIYGGAAPPASDGTEENQEDIEEDEDGEPVASISGTTTYDNGDFKVTVTTSEISRVEEIVPSVKIEVPTTKESIGAQTKHNVPAAKKKPFKRVAKHKSRPKSKNGRDKKNGKKKNNKRR